MAKASGDTQGCHQHCFSIFQEGFHLVLEREDVCQQSVDFVSKKFSLLFV